MSRARSAIYLSRSHSSTQGFAGAKNTPTSISSRSSQVDVHIISMGPNISLKASRDSTYERVLMSDIPKDAACEAQPPLDAS